MSNQCYQCKQDLNKNRWRMSVLLTLQACKTLYNEHFTNEDISKLFLCQVCRSSIRKVTVGVTKGSNKRCLPSEKKQQSIPKERKPNLINSALVKICQQIKAYQYDLAISNLIKIPTAKNALMKVLQSVMKYERIKLCHTESCLSQELNEETLDSFRWHTVVSDCREVAPITVTFLEAMFPKPERMTRQRIYGSKTNKREQTVEEAKEELVARHGTVLALALYTCRPKKYKFVQACIGVELWRHGAADKVFQSLNRLGICQRAKSSRYVVDRLCQHREEALLAWKKGVETNISGEQPMEIEQEEMGRCLRLYRPVPKHGYALSWNNVHLTAQVNLPEHNEPIEKSFGPWAVCFAVNNRLEPPVDGGGEKAASTLPAYSFVPGPRDYWELRKYMISVVKRILIENFSFLGNLQKRLITKVSHRYTAQLSRKSQVINLGVMDVGPSSDSGSAGVISKLQQYVPRKAGVPSPLVCCGDGLSVEQIIQSHTGHEPSVEQMIQTETGQEPSVEQMIQSETGQENWNTSEGQLLGLIPAPKESRKEVLLLQDYMDTFIKTDSTCCRGTLANLKKFFERYTLCWKDVQYNFQQGWDLMELSTCAYVALHAMEVMGISKQDDIPESYPSHFYGQKAWLDRVCMEVVDFVWLAPTREDIKKVAESITHGDEVNMEGVIPDGLEGSEDREEPMMRCCSALCPTSWSRHSGTRLTDSEDDWYCSSACKQDKSYIYCKCQLKKKEEIMIQCYLEGDCKRHEWYHKECVVSAQDPIPDKWYCSDECALGCEGDDPVQNYSRQLMWDGLNALVRRDAVCEGNGAAIVTHWRMDMIQFHNQNHAEHLIIGAHFLAGVAGFYKESIAFNLTWNRLANISGRAVSNISMDLVTESRYNELKERLFFYHGLYNEKEIHLRWQICGEFGKSIGRLCAKADCENPESASEHGICKNIGEVRRFLCEYQKDALTHYLPIRCHKRFVDFTCNRAIKEPCDLRRKIGSICEELDNWRALSTT